MPQLEKSRSSNKVPAQPKVNKKIKIKQRLFWVDLKILKSKPQKAQDVYK